MGVEGADGLVPGELGVPLLSPASDDGGWLCEGGGALVGLEGDGGVFSALDEPLLDEVVGVAELETLKESSAAPESPSESCKLAVNEKLPGAVGVPDRVPAIESSDRPGGR